MQSTILEREAGKDCVAYDARQKLFIPMECNTVLPVLCRISKRISKNLHTQQIQLGKEESMRKKKSIFRAQPSPRQWLRLSRQPWMVGHQGTRAVLQFPEDKWEGFGGLGSGSTTDVSSLCLLPSFAFSCPGGLGGCTGCLLQQTRWELPGQDLHSRAAGSSGRLFGSLAVFL